jgi:hypothetical protein
MVTNTVAILAQGTHWAVATSQAFWLATCEQPCGISSTRPNPETTISIVIGDGVENWALLQW